MKTEMGALGKNEETHGRIRLISLTGDSVRNIEVADWNHLQAVAWASDGGLFLQRRSPSKRAPLLRVALEGNTRILYRGLKYVENPVSSPDGRYLFFGEMGTGTPGSWIFLPPVDSASLYAPEEIFVDVTVFSAGSRHTATRRTPITSSDYAEARARLQKVRGSNPLGRSTLQHQPLTYEST